METANGTIARKKAKVRELKAALRQSLEQAQTEMASREAARTTQTNKIVGEL